MKPRDLVKLVEPDHVPTLIAVQPHLHDWERSGQTILLRCSCGYEASLIENLKFTISYPEMTNELRDAWIRYEMTEHLLDQEIEVEQVLLQIERGELR